MESPEEWGAARNKCESDNAVLVTIDNAEENDFVSGLSDKKLWIGLNDIAQEGHYVWASNLNSTYSRWEDAGNQPDNFNNNEHCIHIYETVDVWNDLPCNSLLSYVCEKGQCSLERIHK